MDEQEKERMRQAVEFAKQRVSSEREKEGLTPVVAMLPAIMNPPLIEQKNRGVVAIAGAYPPILFETQPLHYSRIAETLEYLCPTCGEFPGLLRKSNGFHRRPCQCVQDEHDRQDILRFREHVRQERLAVPVKERITYTWLGMDYSSLAEHSLTNFEMQHQRGAFALVAGYAKQILTRGAEKDNLLIYGEKAGLGKTHLAAALLNLCYENGYSCLFMLAKDYFDALWASDFKDRLALRQRAARADFLLIDDIDKAEQKDTSTMKSEFFQLLNLRYEAGRPTFLTANSADLSRWFNEWTISRVQERMLRIPVAGRDYREIRAERARQGKGVNHELHAI